MISRGVSLTSSGQWTIAVLCNLMPLNDSLDCKFWVSHAWDTFLYQYMYEKHFCARNYLLCISVRCAKRVESERKRMRKHENIYQTNVFLHLAFYGLMTSKSKFIWMISNLGVCIRQIRFLNTLCKQKVSLNHAILAYFE